MISLLLRLLFPIVSLFSVTVVFIQAQPSAQASELWTLLFGADCSSPCFMGLHPGVTSAHDAAVQLREHAWVETVESRLVGGQGGYIYWYWKRDVPDWIDGDERGVIWVARGQVDQMWVATTIPLGELVLQLGEPDIKIVDENIDYGHGLYQYRGVYGAVGLVAVSWQQCDAVDPYRTNAILKFREVMDAEAVQSMDYLDQWKYTFNNCKNKR